jgi:hypothetical protein
MLCCAVEVRRAAWQLPEAFARAEGGLPRLRAANFPGAGSTAVARDAMVEVQPVEVQLAVSAKDAAGARTLGGGEGVKARPKEDARCPWGFSVGTFRPPPPAGAGAAASRVAASGSWLRAWDAQTRGCKLHASAGERSLVLSFVHAGGRSADERCSLAGDEFRLRFRADLLSSLTLHEGPRGTNGPSGVSLIISALIERAS